MQNPNGVITLEMGPDGVYGPSGDLDPIRERKDRRSERRYEEQRHSKARQQEDARERARRRQVAAGGQRLRPAPQSAQMVASDLIGGFQAGIRVLNHLAYHLGIDQDELIEGDR